MDTPDTRTRILDAAEEISRERGLKALSMRAIAERVGLSAPAAYRHFAGKREILEAVILRGYGSFSEGLKAARAGLSEPEALLAVSARYYLRYWAKDRRGFLLAAEWGESRRTLSGGAVAAGSFGDLPDLIARILGTRADPGRAGEVARWTAAALYGAACSIVQDEGLGETREETLIDSAVDFLVGAVRAAAAGSGAAEHAEEARE